MHPSLRERGQKCVGREDSGRHVSCYIGREVRSDYLRLMEPSISIGKSMVSRRESLSALAWLVEAGGGEAGGGGRGNRPPARTATPPPPGGGGEATIGEARPLPENAFGVFDPPGSA